MNRSIWYAWGLIFPDCRVVGMAGALWFDWIQVERKLARHGIDLEPVLESWLRFMVGHVMEIEAAAHEKERTMAEAKRR